MKKRTSKRKRGSRRNPNDTKKADWVAWLKTYGPGKFFDAFVANAQDAESACVYCREPIFLDIVEGGGVPDWRTADGDYGCPDSPDTSDDGTGAHRPKTL